MISYDDFTQYAPPASDKAERDAWFSEHGFVVEDLLRVGFEVAEYRLSALEDGDTVGEQQLLLTMQSIFLFGFELAVRCERGEKLEA